MKPLARLLKWTFLFLLGLLLTLEVKAIYRYLQSVSSNPLPPLAQ